MPEPAAPRCPADMALRDLVAALLRHGAGGTAERPAEHPEIDVAFAALLLAHGPVRQCEVARHGKIGRSIFCRSLRYLGKVMISSIRAHAQRRCRTRLSWRCRAIAQISAEYRSLTGRSPAAQRRIRRGDTPSARASGIFQRRP